MCELAGDPLGVAGPSARRPHPLLIHPPGMLLFSDLEKSEHPCRVLLSPDPRFLEGPAWQAQGFYRDKEGIVSFFYLSAASRDWTGDFSQ